MRNVVSIWLVCGYKRENMVVLEKVEQDKRATHWSGTNKNRDVSTWPLARPIARLLAQLTRSLTPSLMGKRIFDVSK